MTRLAAALRDLGWRLRTGGCDGADSAFRLGSLNQVQHGGYELTDPKSPVDLFLPWASFGKSRMVGRDGLTDPTERAHEIAAEHHPGWANLNQAARKLHARNVHIVLGRDCKTPATFVLCWTPDGATCTAETSAKTGGTGQAIRVATAYDVRVWNLQRADHVRVWRELA